MSRNAASVAGMIDAVGHRHLLEVEWADPVEAGDVHPILVRVGRGIAGEGAWPGHRAVPVLEDIDTLIASPALLERRPIRTPADIEGHVLLASETRAGDWIDWLDAAGLPHLAGHPRQTFDHFFVTRQAVEDGLGIGIGPLPMLEIDIAAGKLVAPLPKSQVRRTGYVAIIPDHAERVPVLSSFVDWLAEQGHRPDDYRANPMAGFRSVDSRSE